MELLVKQTDREMYLSHYEIQNRVNTGLGVLEVKGSIMSDYGTGYLDYDEKHYWTGKKFMLRSKTLPYKVMYRDTEQGISEFDPATNEYTFHYNDNHYHIYCFYTDNEVKYIIYKSVKEEDSDTYKDGNIFGVINCPYKLENKMRNYQILTKKANAFDCLMFLMYELCITTHMGDITVGDLKAKNNPNKMAFLEKINLPYEKDMMEDDPDGIIAEVIEPKKEVYPSYERIVNGKGNEAPEDRHAATDRSTAEDGKPDSSEDGDAESV